MFQRLKLILQKPKNIFLLSIIGILIVGIVINSGEMNSCGIRHVSLLNDIKTFEQKEDPEFCEITLNKILDFNEQCEPYIEILDCG
jgi:hypothetical protein